MLISEAKLKKKMKIKIKNQNSLFRKDFFYYSRTIYLLFLFSAHTVFELYFLCKKKTHFTGRPKTIFREITISSNKAKKF